MNTNMTNAKTACHTATETVQITVFDDWNVKQLTANTNVADLTGWTSTTDRHTGSGVFLRLKAPAKTALLV